MSEIESLNLTPSDAVTCAECGTRLDPGTDREVTDEKTFCRPCYDRLVAQLQAAVAAQSQDVNYPLALLGALGGAAVGVVAWWGFTVLTGIAVGFVAIVIGVGVGKGAVLVSGGKRSAGLQAMSVAVSVVAFTYASYLVNRTFVHRAFAAEGYEGALPLLPDLSLLVEVVRLDFGVMDLIFLGIVVFEAWRIPAPVRLASQ